MTSRRAARHVRNGQATADREAADLVLGRADHHMLAIQIDEDGATTEEVEEYVRRWDLGSDEKAAHTVEFLVDPSSRAYVPAYPEGRRICRAFADRAPGNITRLLTEQLTPADLLG